MYSVHSFALVCSTTYQQMASKFRKIVFRLRQYDKHVYLLGTLSYLHSEIIQFPNYTACRTPHIKLFPSLKGTWVLDNLLMTSNGC